VLSVNCVVVRGGVQAPPRELRETREVSSAPPPGESFVIDSPVLPDELDALPTLLEQAAFPTPCSAASPFRAPRWVVARTPPSGCALTPGRPSGRCAASTKAC